MNRLILRLYHFLEERPKWVYLSLIATLMLFGWGISRIHFSEDISDFLPQTKEDKLITEAYQHIGTTNTILVTLSFGSDTCTDEQRTRLCTIANEWVEKYKSLDSTIIQKIFFTNEEESISEIPDFIAKNLALYTTTLDYQRLSSMMADKEQIRQELQWDKEMLFSAGGSFLQDVILNDPLHLSQTQLKSLSNYQKNQKFNTYNGHIFSKDSTSLLITLISRYPSSESSINKEWIQIIDETCRFIQEKDEVNIQHIGAAEISVGNAEQIKKDTILSSILSLLLIVALLIAFFKDLRAIALILFAIAFGGMASLFFLSVFRDHLSFISIGIGSIIVGIAVNYPLHFLAHLREGHSREETIHEIITPLVIGNITTVGAFLSILFIQSNAMKDMGIFSALLLVGTILFVLVFLPHIFKKGLFHRHSETQGEDRLFFGRLAHWEVESHTWIVLLVILLSIPLFFFGNKVRFETDLHKINYMTDGQRTLLNRLIEETESPYDKTYCVSHGKDLDEALYGYEQTLVKLLALKRNDGIKNISSIQQLLPSRQWQEKRMQEWDKYWATSKEPFIQQLLQVGKEEGFPEEFFAPFIDQITRKNQPIPLDSFAVLRETLLLPYIYESNDQCFIYTMIESDNLDTDNIGNVMKSCAPQPLVFQNQSILQKMLVNLNNSFNIVLFFCGFIVFFFLWISFGRMELSLLAFMPLTFGWIWILGLMGIFDMHFNIVNIILATFIFGQGDDYTIFVTEGLMYEHTYGKKVVASYKNSILLSACVMFFGMGALILAQHPAMKSLAEVTLVGMFSVILMAYVLPPFLFKWLIQSNGQKRREPVTLKNWLFTLYSFIIFLIGSVVLSVIGFFLLTLGGKSEEHKLKYHQLICKTFRLLTRVIPNIEYHVSNPTGFQFDKPSVLISNHQSHLDLMYILALDPKIICLTNKWVWNCPFYGTIIRYAEYYPISNGIEGSEEILKSAVERGYSILIFPEGTRSEDCSIKRFHQGAFYLAERLKVDIVPILIHGIGHVFPKTEFILHKGRVDVEILPALSVNHEFRKKKTTKEVADTVRNYYKDEYERLAREIETPDYFREAVLHSYLYKGRSIYNEAKKNLAKMDEAFIQSLPEEGEYTWQNCGQGEVVLVASLVKKQLHIIATDEDKEKQQIAMNSSIKPNNLTFQ